MRGLDHMRLAVVLGEAAAHHRPLRRRLDDRPGDQVRERDLHPALLERAVDRLALRVEASTASVLNEVAVGIARLSSIALASIAAGPRSGLRLALGAGAGAAAAAPSPSAAASTSSLVTLPPGPEP